LASGRPALAEHGRAPCCATKTWGTLALDAALAPNLVPLHLRPDARAHRRLVQLLLLEVEGEAACARGAPGRRGPSGRCGSEPARCRVSVIRSRSSGCLCVNAQHALIASQQLYISNGAWMLSPKLAGRACDQFRTVTSRQYAHGPSACWPEQARATRCAGAERRQRGAAPGAEGSDDASCSCARYGCASACAQPPPSPDPLVCGRCRHHAAATSRAAGAAGNLVAGTCRVLRCAGGPGRMRSSARGRVALPQQRQLQ
jgi:hypothetical protein